MNSPALHLNVLQERCGHPALPVVLACLCGVGALTPGQAQQKVTQHRAAPAANQRVIQGTARPASVVVTPGRPAFDYQGIGGSVYATGLGEVTVTVYNVGDFLRDKQDWVYATAVGLVTTNGIVPLGSNKDKTRTRRLGRLPRGEIELAINCAAGDGLSRSGPGERNADNKPRSRVREIRPGVVEVYFEVTINEGLANDQYDQHWYKDVKLTFTGAVTANRGLVKLLDDVNSPDPQARRVARTTLETDAPWLARQVKYEPFPPLTAHR